MTWKEFKDFVDLKMKELDIPEDAGIEWLDTGNYPSKDSIVIAYSKKENEFNIT